MKGLIAGSWYKRVPNYSYNENVLLMLTLFTHLCPTSGERKIMTSFALVLIHLHKATQFI